MRPFFASILTICFIPAYTQDYVVTTRKDTLRGKVAISSYTNMDRVQLNAEKKKTEFAATAVSTVSLDSQIYQPVRITDGFRLLKLERSGHVSLYLGRQSPGTPYNVPFLVKKSGESMEVSSLRFKKYMITFLEDCSSIEQKIEAGNLGRKDLDKIIDEYNRCIEKQTDKSLIPGSDPVEIY